MSNGPATSLGATTNDGALYSQAYSTDWVAQIAQDYRNGNLFIRGKNFGTWQAWKKVATTDELSNYLTASAAASTYQTKLASTSITIGSKTISLGDSVTLTDIGIPAWAQAATLQYSSLPNLYIGTTRVSNASQEQDITGIRSINGTAIQIGVGTGSAVGHVGINRAALGGYVLAVAGNTMVDGDFAVTGHSTLTSATLSGNLTVNASGKTILGGASANQVLNVKGKADILTGSGQSYIGADVNALVIGNYDTPDVSAIRYYPGIAFTHLTNGNNYSTYRDRPQAWIGTRLESTAQAQGYKTSLVFATRAGALNDSTTYPIERMIISPDGLVTVLGNMKVGNRIYIGNSGQYISADANGIYTSATFYANGGVSCGGYTQ